MTFRNKTLYNASNNPFSIKKIHQLKYRTQTNTIDQIYLKLKKDKTKGIILGSHGTGKSTFLKELIDKLKTDNKNIHFIFMNNEIKFKLKQLIQILSMKNDTVLVIDGLEQIPKIYLPLLYMKTILLNNFIATSHKNKLFPVIHHTSTSFETFEMLTLQLVPSPIINKEQNLQNIYNRNNGNIRECFFELYEIYAKQNKSTY